MEIRDDATGDFVRLIIVGYEFAEARGDEYDDNWLVIRGQARAADEEWAFEDPSLLVDEARSVADWLHTAAAIDHASKVGSLPDLEFIEPNLGLHLEAADVTSVVVRVFLRLEFAPPSADESEDYEDTAATMQLRLSHARLHQAAEEWSAEVAAYPERHQS